MEKVQFRKLSFGHVVQEFDKEGKCVNQYFVAGEEVVYEDGKGNEIRQWENPSVLNLTAPFKMTVE